MTIYRDCVLRAIFPPLSSSTALHLFSIQLSGCSLWSAFSPTHRTAGVHHFQFGIYLHPPSRLSSVLRPLSYPIRRSRSSNIDVTGNSVSPRGVCARLVIHFLKPGASAGQHRVVELFFIVLRSHFFALWVYFSLVNIRIYGSFFLVAAQLNCSSFPPSS